MRLRRNGSSIIKDTKSEQKADKMVNKGYMYNNYI